MLAASLGGLGQEDILRRSPTKKQENELQSKPKLLKGGYMGDYGGLRGILEVWIIAQMIAGYLASSVATVLGVLRSAPAI